MKDYVIVFFSGGKDSTGMLLKMFDDKEQIDEVVMFDMGMEFPQVYEHIKKVEEYINMNITFLRPSKTWDYYMFEHKPNRSESFKQKHPDWETLNGFGWPGPSNRWCNSKLKVDNKEKYVNKIKKEHPDYNVIECLGIAADEPKRQEKKTNKTDEVHTVRLPMVEWGMTGKDALQYCYDRGFDFGGIYKWSGRLSCWCCPLAPISYWRGLYDNEPELWQKLLDMDARTWSQLKDRNSASDLDIRFKLEDEWTALGKVFKGKTRPTREFLDEYNRRRGHDDKGNPVV